MANFFRNFQVCSKPGLLYIEIWVRIISLVEINSDQNIFNFLKKKKKERNRKKIENWNYSDRNWFRLVSQYASWGHFPSVLYLFAHTCIYRYIHMQLHARIAHARFARYPRDYTAHHARMYVFSCLPAVLTASREKGRPPGGRRERGRECSGSFLHDTYFYAGLFALAYGRARATRIDEARSPLCHTRMP